MFRLLTISQTILHSLLYTKYH